MGDGMWLDSQRSPRRHDWQDDPRVRELEAQAAVISELRSEIERLRTWQKAYAKGRAGLVEQADRDFARARELEAEVERLWKAIESIYD